ncbi:MAG: carbon-nitrogen hydrolase family protein [Verrucomicrobiota bacterium]
MFKLALAQMRVEGGQSERNLARAVERIDEAADGGADLVLLPEAMDLGWTDEACRSAAQPIPEGTPCRILMETAARRGIHVCAGLTEAGDGAVYNAAVLIDRSGRLRLTHRKINELDIATSCYTPGRRIEVADTEFGSVGLMICADGFAESEAIGRARGAMGAGLILSPCAWAVEAGCAEPYGDLWRSVYRPVAESYGLWIAAVSNVGPMTSGPWAGRSCIGHSMVFDPSGRDVLTGPYGEDADALLWVNLEI